ISSCIFDFEYAAISSFEVIFPGVQICLCLFHLGNNVWEKFRDEGLFKLGDKDAMRDRRHAYYDLLSVAFLPVKITLEGILEAVSPLGQEERASVLIYFLNTVMNQVQSDIASLESGAPHKRRRTYEVTDVRLTELVVREEVDSSRPSLQRWFASARAVLRRIRPAIIPTTPTGPEFFVPDLDEEQEGTDFFSIVRPFGEDVVVLEVPAGSANPSQTSAGDASRRTVDQDRRGEATIPGTQDPGRVDRNQ
ncbi:hypothetical protein FOL46_003548, partial [Perkinsus olseni]